MIIPAKIKMTLIYGNSTSNIHNRQFAVQNNIIERTKNKRDILYILRGGVLKYVGITRTKDDLGFVIFFDLGHRNHKKLHKVRIKNDINANITVFEGE